MKTQNEIIEWVILHQCIFSGNEKIGSITADEARKYFIEPLQHYLSEHSNKHSETDINKCPKCGGSADNGHDRCYPPSPYYCTKCNKPSQNTVATPLRNTQIKNHFDGPITVYGHGDIMPGETLMINGEGKSTKT